MKKITARRISSAVIVLKKHVPGSGKKHFTRFGKRNAITVSDKKRNPQLLLKMRQLLTECRLCDEQPIRRLGNASTFTDADKILNLCEVHKQVSFKSIHYEV